MRRERFTERGDVAVQGLFTSVLNVLLKVKERFSLSFSLKKYAQTHAQIQALKNSIYKRKNQTDCCIVGIPWILDSPEYPHLQHSSYSWFPSLQPLSTGRQRQEEETEVEEETKEKKGGKKKVGVQERFDGFILKDKHSSASSPNADHVWKRLQQECVTMKPLCFLRRPQWKLHSSLRMQLPLALILYSAPHRQHTLFSAAEGQRTVRPKTGEQHRLGQWTQKVWRFTVCIGLFGREVVYDGSSSRLRVWSRVSVLLELLLRHQVALQFPVQYGSYNGRGKNKLHKALRHVEGFFSSPNRLAAHLETLYKNKQFKIVASCIVLNNIQLLPTLEVSWYGTTKGSFRHLASDHKATCLQ